MVDSMSQEQEHVPALPGVAVRPGPTSLYLMGLMGLIVLLFPISYDFQCLK